MWSPADVKDLGRVKHSFKLEQGLFTMNNISRVHQCLHGPSATHAMKEATLCGMPKPLHLPCCKTNLLCVLQLNHKVAQVEAQNHSSHQLPWPAAFLWEYAIPRARRQQGTCDNGDAKTLQHPFPSRTSLLSVSSGLSGYESHRELRAFTIS